MLTLLLFLLSLQEAFEDTAAADGRFCCCQTHGVFLTCREEEEEGWRNGVKDDNGAGGLRVILMVIWFLQTLVGMKWHQAMLACQPSLPKLFFSLLFRVFVSFWLSGTVCLDTVFLREEAAISFLSVFFNCSALTLQTLLSFCLAPEFVFLASVRCR